MHLPHDQFRAVKQEFLLTKYRSSPEHIITLSPPTPTTYTDTILQ